MNKTKQDEDKRVNDYGLFNQINEVCKLCIHSCKQLSNVTVVYCPQRKVKDDKD